MSLPSNYCQAIKSFPSFFEKIKNAQAPEKFTLQIIKDWGFKSVNNRAFLPLLKTLGFLTEGGAPTDRYNEYRNSSKSKIVMGQALKEFYSDLFLISENPNEGDKTHIQGKFKSFHNTTDNSASLMMRTFYALLELADLTSESNEVKNEKDEPIHEPVKSEISKSKNPVDLCYNIQIHLPATKDIDTYNAIFKSLKVHLLD